MARQACACTESPCTRDIRRVLRTQFRIGQTVELTTLSGRTLKGKLVRVTQGTIVISVNGVRNYVPICRV